MLFILIERFQNNDMVPVYRRVREGGRSLPEGLKYIDSWIEPTFERCFQLMEAPHLDALNLWTALWSDLVHFEIVPVQTSADFWSARQPKSS